MLDGKVAIVTGGGGSLGYEVVKLMIERGARVVVADADTDKAHAAADAFGEAALAVEFNLAEEDSVKAMIERAVSHFGRLDILDNNAAEPSSWERFKADLVPVGEMPTWLWDQVFTVNCRGTMIATREALPHLIATRGAIVNMVSNLALQGAIVQSAYSASKAALIQLTRHTAAAYGRKGVRCNAVAPGLTIRPEMRQGFFAELAPIADEETLNDSLGLPEDIGQIVAFLASDAARNITGQTIVSDGGLSSHVPGLERYFGLFRE